MIFWCEMLMTARNNFHESINVNLCIAIDMSITTLIAQCPRRNCYLINTQIMQTPNLSHSDCRQLHCTVINISGDPKLQFRTPRINEQFIFHYIFHYLLSAEQRRKMHTYMICMFSYLWISLDFNHFPKIYLWIWKSWFHTKYTKQRLAYATWK